MYFYSFTNQEHHDFRRAAHVIHTKMAIIGKPPDRGAQRTTPRPNPCISPETRLWRPNSAASCPKLNASSESYCKSIL